jgi:subtilisin family serine protease
MYNYKELNKIKTSLPIICIEEINDLSKNQIIDWGVKQSKIPETWKITKGEGVKIIVIDTGHPVHEDIGDNAKIGENFILNEPHEDLNGHQSHCTGIICSKNNKFGMVGVAPRSTCVSVKALNKNGSGTFDGLVKALEYAIDEKPDIVSMSLGSSRPHALIEQKIKTLYEMNIPVICAAGNSGHSGVNWPAAYEETIAVAAYDEMGRIASFSSKGPEVDWAAPGVNVYSTFLNNSYAVLSGTSMACPFMVGIVALMLSKHKKQEKESGQNDCKTVDQIKEHLLKYTIDKGDSGKDNYWGHGIVNVKDLIIEDSKPEPKPEPEPKPKPEPEPKPKPEPEPKPELKFKDWFKKYIAWIVLSAFALFVGAVGLYQCSQQVDVPKPPYIDENGNVDWDKKFQNEQK